MADIPSRCTLMGCTNPTVQHDHHMYLGHLDIVACQCKTQSGEPGSKGEDHE